MQNYTKSDKIEPFLNGLHFLLPSYKKRNFNFLKTAYLFMSTYSSVYILLRCTVFIESTYLKIVI